MDDIALRKALATLRSFADNMPKGVTVEEKYIAYYHQLLTDISNETGHNLDYFRIPDGELKRRLSGGYTDDDGSWHQNYTEHKECDRDVFVIKFNGALNFMASFLDAPAKRIIGFSS